MARIRTIKPEFWLNEELSQVSEPARLVAIGLLNLCDDDGWFKSHVRLVESALFPFSEPSVSIHECLTQLSEIGYIKIYNGVDSKQYGMVVNFDKHQKVNRPTPSKIKGLIDFTEDSVSSHEQLTGGKERKGKEGKGTGNREQGKEISPAAVCDAKTVFDFWHSTMQKPKSVKATPGRMKVIKARLKDYSVDNLKTAIVGCTKSGHHMGKNPQSNPEGRIYDDLTLIMRNPENVDRFMSYANQISIEDVREAEVDAWINGDDHAASSNSTGETFDNGQFG